MLFRYLEHLFRLIKAGTLSATSLFTHFLDFERMATEFQTRIPTIGQIHVARYLSVRLYLVLHPPHSASRSFPAFFFAAI